MTEVGKSSAGLMFRDSIIINIVNKWPFYRKQSTVSIKSVFKFDAEKNVNNI